MNQSKEESDPYLSEIEAGRRLRAVTGILGQYTNLGDGYDYYQFLTLSEACVVGLCPADLDRDGNVDLGDYQSFTDRLLAPSAPSSANSDKDTGRLLAADAGAVYWLRVKHHADQIVHSEGNCFDLDLEGVRLAGTRWQRMMLWTCPAALPEATTTWSATSWKRTMSNCCSTEQAPPQADSSHSGSRRGRSVSVCPATLSRTPLCSSCGKPFLYALAGHTFKPGAALCLGT
jgi:hypothetical protein